MELNQEKEEKPKPQILNRFADWQRSREVEQQLNRVTQQAAVQVQNRSIPDTVKVDGSNNRNTSTFQAGRDKNNNFENNASKNFNSQATASSLNSKDYRNNKFENNASRNFNSQATASGLNSKDHQKSETLN
jgi:hypothetical protein